MRAAISMQGPKEEDRFDRHRSRLCQKPGQRSLSQVRMLHKFSTRKPYRRTSPHWVTCRWQTVWPPVAFRHFHLTCRCALATVAGLDRLTNGWPVVDVQMFDPLGRHCRRLRERRGMVMMMCKPVIWSASGYGWISTTAFGKV